MTEVLIANAALLALVFSGVQLGFAALAVGPAAFALHRSPTAAASMAGRRIGDLILSASLIIIPVFVLMGEQIRRARVAEELYESGIALVGRFRGGWPCRG